MKSKPAFVVIAFCILLPGIAAAYHVQVTATPDSYNFTITAFGGVSNLQHTTTNEFVDVNLTVTGSTRGELTRVTILFVKGGDLDVENYETLSVFRGSGVLVQSCTYIHLHIKMTSSYGGEITVWNLRGTVSGDLITISSRRVVLPLPDRPRLYSLLLIGTITT